MKRLTRKEGSPQGAEYRAVLDRPSHADLNRAHARQLLDLLLQFHSRRLSHMQRALAAEVECNRLVERVQQLEDENAELKQAIRDRLEPVFEQQQAIVEELHERQKASE